MNFIPALLKVRGFFEIDRLFCLHDRIINYMSSLSQKIDTDNLHHAYVLEGEHEQILPELVSMLESMGIPCEGNPDVMREFFDMFTIDQSRELKARQIEKGNVGGKKIFILGVQFFTVESQHALLKVFEEPASDVHFFIITPRADALLDTLKSRLVIVRSGEHLSSQADMKTGNDFLNMTRAERIKKIAKFIKDHDDEDAHESLKADAIRLLNSIELALWKKEGEKATPENHSLFEEIQKCRGYMADRGASAKMLLEHIALIVPET